MYLNVELNSAGMWLWNWEPFVCIMVTYS